MSYRHFSQRGRTHHAPLPVVARDSRSPVPMDTGFRVTGAVVADNLVLTGGPVDVGELPAGRKALTIAPDGRVVYSTVDPSPEDVSGIVASIGQPNGLATLDATGNVPAMQLNNALQMPTEKGVLLTSDGTTVRALSAGADGYALLSDSTQLRGLRYGQVDHTRLLNTGANTHAELDAFVNSKDQLYGLASLDGTGNVPLVQLGNITPVTSNHEARITALEGNDVPEAAWNEAAWAAALADQKNGIAIPIYRGTTDGSGVPTYFINTAATANQPFAIELTFKNTRSVSLVIDPGSPTESPLVGTYKLKAGTYNGLLLPAPAFVTRKIAAGTYADEWSGGNPITLASPTDLLGFYIGVGFPEGPTTFPPGSPFSLGYTLNGSAYLDSAAVPTQVRGWKKA